MLNYYFSVYWVIFARFLDFSIKRLLLYVFGYSRTFLQVVVIESPSTFR